MNDEQRFLSWCEEGVLIRPGPAHPNLVDLAGALAEAVGASHPNRADVAGAAAEAVGAGSASGAASEMNQRAIAARIGSPKHLVFVLVDGMGAALLEHLQDASFLRTHCVEVLHSVFPSTTAAALTSVATGLWPCTHAVLSWWLHFPRQAVSATILPFIERFTETPLGNHGVTPAQAFPAAPLASRIPRDTLSMLPKSLAASTYSAYHGGGRAIHSYRSVRDAVSLVVQRAMHARAPTYTHLYVPQLDSLTHKAGPDHARVIRLLTLIDREMARLRENLPREALLVITADHGLAALPRERAFFIRARDPLMEHLQCPPTGDPTLPIFHVKTGQEERFASEFRARHGEMFALLSTEQVERLALFGPAPLSDAARERAGDFLAVPPRPTLLCWRDEKSPRDIQRGVHAGLTPAEMRIPLVIA